MKALPTLWRRAGIKAFMALATLCALAGSAFATDTTPTPIPTIDYAPVQDALTSGFVDVVQRAMTIIVSLIAVAIGLWGLLWIVRNAPRWFRTMTGQR